MIKPHPRVTGLAPYALAKTDIPPDKRPILLAQNESPLPPSPNAIEAAQSALRGARLYPDPDVTALRQAIADVHDLDVSQLLCGAGSMELIAALVSCYAGPGDTVLSTDYGYAFFKVATQIAGACYVTAAELDFRVSVDQLLPKVDETTRLVMVANPGNPTGTSIPRADLVRLREALPDNILLVIDEAYGEFDGTPSESTFDLVARGDTVVLRTFSKAYGLAGMRIGWGLFPPTILEEVRKILLPNNIGVAAQAAATAAMRDQAHMTATVAETCERRDRFAARVREMGLRVPGSQTNFVLIQFTNAEQAAAADAALRAEGIVLRGMGGYGLSDCLRASIGSEDEMIFTADILANWCGKEKAA